MRRAARLTLTGLALVALAACDAPPPREAAEAEVEAGEQETTVFDDTIQTQDRARAVEDLTLGRKSELDAAIDQPQDDVRAEDP